jgi:hypothetical protein
MFALFREMDVMRGGGHARTALLEYMNSYVLALTKENSNNLIKSSVSRRNPQQWQSNKAAHAAVRLVTLRWPSAHSTVTTLKQQPLPASTWWTWPGR